MIHPLNNNYDLESIEVRTDEPFSVGGTRIGRASSKNWLVHWLDATTLLIAPEHQPNAWVPAHIYNGGAPGFSGAMQGFILIPSEHDSEVLEALDKVLKVDSLHEAVDAIEGVIADLPTGATAEPDRVAFGDLCVKLCQARDLINEAKNEAGHLFAAHSPPSTEEPAKLPSRSRR